MEPQGPDMKHAVTSRQGKAKAKRILASQKGARKWRYNDPGLKGFPLQEAVSYGDITAVQQLVQTLTRSNLNSVDSNGMTALHYAAKSGSNEIVLLLLDCGASVDLKTKHGAALQTAMRYASVGGIDTLTCSMVTKQFHVILRAPLG